MGTWTVAEIVTPESAAAMQRIYDAAIRREARREAARKGWATRKARKA